MDFEGKNEYNKEKNDFIDSEEVAYQNKDITSKYLAENFKGKTFQVYGLNLPEIKQVFPTNIPTIKVNELRLDNLFGLADGTVAVVDYESDYKEADKVKYLNYLTGVANRYLKEKQECPMLRMIVIYTGDIKRESVSEDYNIGAVKIKIESAFLSELDSKEIYLRLQNKIEQGQMLTDEELMEFIILPLSYKTREEKEIHLEKIVELAVHIKEKEQQLFVLSGILAFTDKIINMETANKIRRAIRMTQVAQIFEEEKRQAITQVARIFEEEKRQAVMQATRQYEEEKRQAVMQATRKYEEEKQQAVMQVREKYEEEKRQAVMQATRKYEEEKIEAEEAAAENTSRQIIIKMLKKNYPAEEISQLVAGYTKEDIERFRKDLESEL